MINNDKPKHFKSYTMFHCMTYEISVHAGIKLEAIGHVNNIPTMQCFTEISRNTQSNCFMLSLTKWVSEFQHNASWDYSLTCPTK